MKDQDYGSEDGRGYWKPNDPIRYPDVFIWPPKMEGILRWLPGYIFPWGLFYGLLALLVWTFLTPSMTRMQNLSLDWVALIALRNAVLLSLIVGTQHYWLYIKRAQATAFKYNRKWPDVPKKGFTFGTQIKDNLFWTFCFGLPIWTMWECLTLWAFANGWIASLNVNAHPVWFFVLWFFVPLLHEFHFYWIHRLIHWPPLYNRVHKVHHRNTNPGPWSGLSPAQGHTGFDRVITGANQSVHLPYYAHYLHHRLFEVNYADGTIPLDKWFGSFHDGSPEADQALKARLLNMAQRRPPTKENI